MDIKSSSGQAFRLAALRLTLLYVGILALLSLACSVWLYRTASTEVGIVATTVIDQRQGSTSGTASSAEPSVILRPNSSPAVMDSRARLLHDLLSFNLLVLGAGTLISYYVALRTLRPLRRSYEQQHQFVANASHELRTPLTALKTELQVALRSPFYNTKKSIEGRQLIQRSLKEVDYLADLTSKLLHLTQPAARQSSQSTALGVAVERLRRRLVPGLQEKHMSLHIESVPVRIRINPDELLELLTILCDNAIKYSPAHTTITLRTQVYHKTATIMVADAGPGICAEDAARIFDRFYRAASTRHNAAGHGLGLAIAKNIVEMAGGSISVRTNMPQPGTTFIVQLPA